MDRVREQILGYLLGILDDSERERVEACLERDPEYQRQWAELRRRLAHFEAAEETYPPPPGLARRTCNFVFAHARPKRSPAPRPAPMSPHSALPSWGSRLGWLDVTVAAAVFLVAGLLVLPAIQGSRFQARLIACQNNLRQLGLALADYSHRNDGYFPAVPAEGKLAAAGIYAPVLVRNGFLTESQCVLCPDSPMAERRDFRIPSIEELQAACERETRQLRQLMGGSYGYCLGHLEHGVFRPTKDLSRAYFAIMADTPSQERPDHQSLNHGGCGQNVLFEDGHVEFATNSQPVPGADDIFANDDHVVAPGVRCDDSVIAPSGTPPIIYVSNSH